MYGVSVAECVEYFRGIQITIGPGDLLDKLLCHVQLFFSSRGKIDPGHYQVQFQDCHDELRASRLGSLVMITTIALAHVKSAALLRMCGNVLRPDYAVQLADCNRGERSET
jgi:hypothetical protein